MIEIKNIPRPVLRPGPPLPGPIYCLAAEFPSIFSQGPHLIFIAGDFTYDFMGEKEKI